MINFFVSVTWVQVLLPMGNQRPYLGLYEEEVHEKLREIDVDMTTMTTVSLDLPFQPPKYYRPGSGEECEAVQPLNWPEVIETIQEFERLKTVRMKSTRFRTLRKFVNYALL